MPTPHCWIGGWVVLCVSVVVAVPYVLKSYWEAGAGKAVVERVAIV